MLKAKNFQHFFVTKDYKKLLMKNINIIVETSQIPNKYMKKISLIQS